MYEIFSDADAGYTHTESRRNNLASGRVGVAHDVGGISPRVRTVTAPALRLVPSNGAIGARQFQRDASEGAHRVKGCHKALLHILQRARRDASLEFGLFEILCSYHNRLLLVILRHWLLSGGRIGTPGTSIL